MRLPNAPDRVELNFPKADNHDVRANPARKPGPEFRVMPVPIQCFELIRAQSIGRIE